MPGDPQPAVQHVHRRGQHQCEQDGREQERQQHPQERIHEDEERDVQVELRVLVAERHPVDEQQPGTPVARGREAGDQPDQAEQHDHDAAPVRVDRLPVCLDALVTWTGRRVGRPQPVRDHEVRADDAAHEHGGNTEEQPFRAVGRGEDPRLVHGAVPEVVGPDASDDRDQDCQYHDDDHRGDDESRPAGQHYLASAARLRAGNSEGHRSSLRRLSHVARELRARGSRPGTCQTRWRRSTRT